MKKTTKKRGPKRPVVREQGALDQLAKLTEGTGLPAGYVVERLLREHGDQLFRQLRPDLVSERVMEAGR